MFSILSSAKFLKKLVEIKRLYRCNMTKMGEKSIILIDLILLDVYTIIE